MEKFGKDLVGVHHHAPLLFIKETRLSIAEALQIKFKCVFYVGLRLGNKDMSMCGLVS